MFITHTICNSCGTRVHRAPGVCELCGESLTNKTIGEVGSIPLLPMLPRADWTQDREAVRPGGEGRHHNPTQQKGRDNKQPQQGIYTVESQCVYITSVIVLAA